MTLWQGDKEIAVIAQGAFGQIRAVGDAKVLKEPKDTSNREQLKQLLNEAAVHKQLEALNKGAPIKGKQKGPHLVWLGKKTGLLVHKYDSDLSERAIKGPISSKDFALGARNIFSCLAFMHSHDIPHRDIKGGNILVDKLGWYLSDFGDVKCNFAEKDNWAAGTNAFMTQDDWLSLVDAHAENDVARGIELGKQSDVFAACLTLYTVVNGPSSTPIERESGGLCLAGNGFTPEGEDGLRKLGQLYGFGVENLVRRGLSNDRDVRPTADELNGYFEAQTLTGA